MKKGTLLPILLIALGIALALVSVPYVAENLELGLIGVASGALVGISAIGPLVKALRSGEKQHED